MTDGADERDLVGVNCGFTISMLDTMAVRYGLPAERDKIEKMASSSNSGLQLPNYVLPCPVLIKYKPFLAKGECQSPLKARKVIQVIRTTNGSPSPLVGNPVSVVPEVPAPREPVVAKQRTEPVKNPKKAIRQDKERISDLDQQFGPPTRKRAPKDAAPAESAVSLPHVRTRSGSRRPTYKERIQHLKPEMDRIPDSTPLNIRILSHNDKDPKAERLKRSFKSMGISCKAPKSSIVRTKEGSAPVTHVVLPRIGFQSYFATAAIANGAWRVPYEWAEECIKTGTIVDERSYGDSYRSKHRLFYKRTFMTFLTNLKESEAITTALLGCGAIPTDDAETADIIILDDSALDGCNPQHWSTSDFKELYTEIQRSK